MRTFLVIGKRVPNGESESIGIVSAGSNTNAREEAKKMYPDVEIERIIKVRRESPEERFYKSLWG